MNEGSESSGKDFSGGAYRNLHPATIFLNISFSVTIPNLNDTYIIILFSRN